MKRTLTLVILALAVTVWVLPAAAQEIPENKKQLMQMYHVVVVKHGPNWVSQHSQEGADIRMEVIENIKKGARSGLIVSAGLVNDETDAEFIVILDVETKYEALEILNAAPNYKNGVFAGEIYSWFAPKGLRFN